MDLSMANDRLLRGMETFCAFIGAITGLLALALVIFKGGMLVQTISDHDGRLKVVEQAGTLAAQMHIRVDDDRDKEIQTRIAKMESVMTTIIETRADVRIMSIKIDTLAESLNEHKKAISGP